MRVRCRCDNMAAVQIIASRFCRDSPLMHLLCFLFFIEAYFEFDLVAAHIPGVYNALADSLSRDNLSYFHQQAPHMDPLPMAVPR